MRNPNPGDPVRAPSARRERDLNEMVRQFRQGGLGPTFQKGASADGNSCLVRNSDAGDVERFDCMVVKKHDAANYDSDQWKNLHPLSAEIAGGPLAADQQLVIAQQSIKENSSGLCRLAGISLAWVNIDDVDHCFADTELDSWALVSKPEGPVKIIDWIGGSTGLKLCLITWNAGESTPLRLVKMHQIAGDNGDAETMNDYRYDVYDITGQTLLASNISVPYSGDPNRQHDYQTQELGEVDPATKGLAYYNDQDQFVIHDCNEQYRVGPCEDGGGAMMLVDGSDRYRVDLAGDILSIAARDGANRDHVQAVVTVGNTKHFDGWFPAPSRSLKVPSGSVTVELKTYDSVGEFKQNTNATYSTVG